MNNLKVYEKLWKCIWRPPREVYEPADLGHKSFLLGRNGYTRTDYRLINNRGNKLEWSLYAPDNFRTRQISCVIYAHANSGSRLEAMKVLPQVLNAGLWLFTFDFSGWGKSEGDYISLGYYEKDDLAIVLEFVAENFNFAKIGLWGRSMGAATCILHGNKSNNVSAYVLDSPFNSIDSVCRYYAKNSYLIPKFIVSLAMRYVRRKVSQYAKFDIRDVKPIENCSKIQVPTLFVVSENDKMISQKNIKKLYSRLPGLKNILNVDGGHNTTRSVQVVDQIARFFVDTLNPSFNKAVAHPGMTKILRKCKTEPPKPSKPKYMDDSPRLNEFDDQTMRLKVQQNDEEAGRLKNAGDESVDYEDVYN